MISSIARHDQEAKVHRKDQASLNSSELSCVESSCHEPRGYIAVDSFKMVMAASRATKRSLTASVLVSMGGSQCSAVRTIAYASIEQESDGGLDDLEIGYRYGERLALSRFD